MTNLINHIKQYKSGPCHLLDFKWQFLVAEISPIASAEYVEDVDLLMRRAERCLEAGADMIMIDPDDICGAGDAIRSDIIAKLIGRLGLAHTMFEASNAATSEWFIQQYGPKVWDNFTHSSWIVHSVFLYRLP